MRITCAGSLKEKYPERRIIVVDSLASSVGYGLMTDTVADMRDNGAGMEETEDWMIQNRNRLQSEFFSTDLTPALSASISGETNGMTEKRRRLRLLVWYDIIFRDGDRKQ